VPYADADGVPYADGGTIWLVDIESDQEQGFQYSHTISELQTDGMIARTSLSPIFSTIIDGAEKKTATTGGYGVCIKNINYATNAGQTTQINLSAKYANSSTTKTGVIDGNYTIKVYRVYMSSL
jgi:hypothetical protein